jgi:hypothetical protein
MVFQPQGWRKSRANHAITLSNYLKEENVYKTNTACDMDRCGDLFIGTTQLKGGT